MSKPKKYCIGTELYEGIVFPEYKTDSKGNIIAFSSYDECLEYIIKNVVFPGEKYPQDFIYYNDNLD